MELYQLRSFIAVAEEKNLTKAAARLNTSQPAVSAQIKALEEELGLALFHRTSKGMAITEDGKKIVRKVEHALNAADEIIDVSKQLQRELTGTVTIGTNSTPEILKISPLINQLSIKHPKLTIKLVSSNSSRILEEVRSGVLDAGFVFGDLTIPGIESLNLGFFKLVVAGGASKGKNLETASWKEIACLPWIGNSQNCPFNRHIDHLFKEKKLERNIAVLADQSETVINMVCAGTGLAVLLLDEIHDLVKSEQICLWDPFNDGINLSFAYLERRESSPPLQAVINLIKGIWEIENKQKE